MWVPTWSERETISRNQSSHGLTLLDPGAIAGPGREILEPSKFLNHLPTVQSTPSKTDPLSPRPIILGAGLTGLAISRALSAAGIAHVLVGEAPGGAPRLGESLNAEGSQELAHQFPDLQRFFTAKQRQKVFFGNHALTVDFLPLRQGRLQDELLGLPASVDLLHVDRVGFDAALFDAVVGDAHCTYLADQAEALTYRQSTDHIEAVEFAGGRRLAASFVFDATNYVRFLARKLGVARTVLGPKRRVVFAHYHGQNAVVQDKTSAQNTGQPVWMKATSLLRLASSTDGFEGLAWCIPLGNYVSLGVSVDPEVTPQRSSLLLDWLERAYALRGLEVRRNFPERSAPQDFVYEHFNHERCAGANWLLTGPTCCQFWFPAAAGVATGLIAARLAAGFLRAPKQTAAVYQDYIDGLAAAHGGLEWLVRDDPWSVSAEELQQRMQKMVIGNVKRFSRAPGIQRTSSELGLGDAFLRLYQADRVLTNPVRVETAVPAVRL